jgi:hypothetical protein
MNWLIRIINRIVLTETPKPIGRWKIETNPKKLDRKIDLSNEDHCGPCGKYILEKLELKGQKKN